MFVLLPVSAQAFDVPDVGEGVCVYNCDDGGSSYSGSSGSSYSYDSAYYNAVGQATYTVFNQLGQSIVESWATAAAAQAQAAAEARAERQQALNYNDQGNAHYANGDWDSAIVAYESALQYSPTDKTIQKNLKQVKAKRLIGFGMAAHNQGDWDQALTYYNLALEVAPEDRMVRKHIRMARSKQSRSAEVEREAQLDQKMAAARERLRAEVDSFLKELDSPDLTAEARASQLNKMEGLRKKGVHFKEVPPPTPTKKKPVYEIPKVKGKEHLDSAIDAANKGIKQWDKVEEWSSDKYKEVGTLVQGEVENRLPGGKLKGIKEGIDDLREKIGGEHKKTIDGLFDHMRAGVEEAGRPDISGDTDERIDMFIQERADGYRDMAREVTEDKIKGAIQQIPDGATAATSDPASTTSPILNKKSFARERAAYLNANK